MIAVAVIDASRDTSFGIWLGRAKRIVIAFLVTISLYREKAAALESSGVQIHFCLGEKLWTYPLDEAHGVNGLLLHSAAIINRGSPLMLTSVDIELLDHQQVKDRRQLTASDIQGLARASSQLMSLLKLVPFQFCGTEMLGTGALLAGPKLELGQALLVLQEPFAFTGRRDTTRLVAHANRRGKAVSGSADIPISAGFPPGQHHVFPLKSVFHIANGPSMHTAHRWTPSEEFVYNIEKIDGDGNSHSGSGSRFEDYYAYGTPVVLAMAAGKVLDVVNDEPEDPTAMIQAGESKELYFARVENDQARRMEHGNRGLAGNYVLIDEGGSSFAWYAHLQPGSVSVRKGDSVSARQSIARLGGTGNSTEPHLHVQLCRGPDPRTRSARRWRFTAYIHKHNSAAGGHSPSPQTGDVVVALYLLRNDRC